MQVNVFGAWRMSQAFLPLLRRSAHPRIVNVSSGAGSHADPTFGLGVPGGAAATYGISTCPQRPDEHASRGAGLHTCHGERRLSRLDSDLPGHRGDGGPTSRIMCSRCRLGGHPARRRAPRWILPRQQAVDLVAPNDARASLGASHQRPAGLGRSGVSAVCRDPARSPTCKEVALVRHATVSACSVFVHTEHGSAWASAWYSRESCMTQPAWGSKPPFRYRPRLDEHHASAQYFSAPVGLDWWPS
jgi:hypothetical protein